MLALGIDIGASHIGLGLYDSVSKKLIKKKYIKYNRPSKIWNYLTTKKSTNTYIKYLVKNIDSFIENRKIKKIGIGCPGGVDSKNGIFYGSTALVVGKIEFNKVLKKYNCPVYIENDANCAAIGTMSIRQETEFLMITIGTGVGFSIVRKTGKNITIAPDFIIWKILKTNRISNTKHDKYISSFKKLLMRQKKSEETFFQNINENYGILMDYIKNFKVGIEKIDKELPINNICIGGSFSFYHKYYIQQLRTILPDFNIFISPYYNDAGIIGAALLPVKTEAQ